MFFRLFIVLALVFTIGAVLSGYDRPHANLPLDRNDAARNAATVFIVDRALW